MSSTEEEQEEEEQEEEQEEKINEGWKEVIFLKTDLS